MEKYITAKIKPSQKYYDYMDFISYYGDKNFVIENRYYRLNFKPHISKINYFYFKNISRNYEDIDPEKAKQYLELAKLFEGSFRYRADKITEQLNEYSKNMSTMGIEIEQLSYDN